MAQQLAMLAASLSAFGARSPRTVDLAALVPEPRRDAPAAVRAARALLPGFVRRRPAGTGRPPPRASGPRFALTDADPARGPTCCSPTSASPRC